MFASRPSEWVERHLLVERPRATLLDVACGGGRHARLGLRRGFVVTAVDRDLSGVADLVDAADVELVEADLESGDGWPLPGRRFDAVVVTNYLWRPRLPDIVRSVLPDGVLIYETFAKGQEVFGRPTNPDFLLAPGELVTACRSTSDAEDSLIPISFEHRRLNDPPRLVQRLYAVGCQHPAAAGTDTRHRT